MNDKTNAWLKKIKARLNQMLDNENWPTVENSMSCAKRAIYDNVTIVKDVKDVIFEKKLVDLCVDWFEQELERLSSKIL